MQRAHEKSPTKCQALNYVAMDSLSTRYHLIPECIQRIASVGGCPDLVQMLFQRRGKHRVFGVVVSDEIHICLIPMPEEEYIVIATFAPLTENRVSGNIRRKRLAPLVEHHIGNASDSRRAIITARLEHKSHLRVVRQGFQTLHRCRKRGKIREQEILTGDFPKKVC